MAPLSERRRIVSERDSLDLLTEQGRSSLELLLNMATQVGEMRECLKKTSESTVRACDLGEQALAHGQETRVLLQRHIEASSKWELVITKLEADLEGREFWRKLARIMRSGVTKAIAFVAMLLGLVVTAHTAMPHIKEWLRGP